VKPKAPTLTGERFVTDDCVEEGGGESACYAHLICPECGTVLDDTAHVRIALG